LQRDQRRHAAPLAGAGEPPLSKVLDENIGRTWRTDLSQLSELEQHIDFRR
jgi:glucan phosphorylase